MVTPVTPLACASGAPAAPTAEAGVRLAIVMPFGHGEFTGRRSGSSRHFAALPWRRDAVLPHAPKSLALRATISVESRARLTCGASKSGVRWPAR
jgi:hypothetical protein